MEALEIVFMQLTLFKDPQKCKLVKSILKLILRIFLIIFLIISILLAIFIYLYNRGLKQDMQSAYALVQPMYSAIRKQDQNRFILTSCWRHGSLRCYFTLDKSTSKRRLIACPVLPTTAKVSP